MEETKNLGVWMDHSTAHFIGEKSDENNKTIASKFTAHTKEEALHKGESHMHSKEQQMQEAYFKAIGEEILPYKHVVLFGPTNAKNELHNYLSKNSHFKDIQIELETTDKMTDQEMKSFVKNYFYKPFFQLGHLENNFSGGNSGAEQG
jgi:hypothetical protein